MLDANLIYDISNLLNYVVNKIYLLYIILNECCL